MTANENRHTAEEAADKLGMDYAFILVFTRSGALLTDPDGLITEEALLDFSRRRNEAAQFVEESRAKAGERTQRIIEKFAPITDEALAEIDNL